MHLYAVCVDCLEGVHKIICIKCKSRWDGSWHQLGTMYTYDILAASPCCQVSTICHKAHKVKLQLLISKAKVCVSLLLPLFHPSFPACASECSTRNSLSFCLNLGG